ncbi:MAG: hypothetical protein ACTSRG_27090 [Candidatus Helarchaeota archaeon]
MAETICTTLEKFQKHYDNHIKENNFTFSEIQISTEDIKNITKFEVIDFDTRMVIFIVSEMLSRLDKIKRFKKTSENIIKLNLEVCWFNKNIKYKSITGGYNIDSFTIFSYRFPLGNYSGSLLLESAYNSMSHYVNIFNEKD